MTFDPRRLPIIGDDVYQAGQVIEILHTPCTGEVTIWVTAFFKYLPMLAWSLVKPDPIDITLNRFQVGHSKKRRRRFRFGFLDVGHKIPLPGGLTRVMFRIIGLQQRIGWYFLVIDATTDFLVNWTSMAYVYNGCPVPGAPKGTVWNTTNTTYLTGTNRLFSMIQNSASTIYTAGGGAIGITNKGPFVATLDASFGKHPSFAAPNIGNVSIIDTNNGNRRVCECEKTSTGPAPGQQTWSGIGKIDGSINNPMLRSIFTCNNAFAVICHSGRMSANGTLDNGVGPDP